jgi:TetR/AcrR family transcriptional regulator, transcriptional repressor for nem operon
VASGKVTGPAAEPPSGKVSGPEAELPSGPAAGRSSDPAAGRSSGRAGKRERLIAAACEVIYAQGVEHSSLADIAAAAEVPLGNVYYYFRTKEDLVQAVIEAQLARARALLAAIEATSDDPRARLRALFGALGQETDRIARYGCPFGSLCLELDKRAEGPGSAASLIRVPIDWAERQFRAMGRADARDLAIEVIARYQGAALLTSTLRDPALMTRETARVADWLDALA